MPEMKKLLIVDNSIRLLEIMKRILERNGYIIKTLNHIEGIYEEINNFQPDLFILDTYLDREDGREVCKKIKLDFHTRHLPVILYSAFPMDFENYRSFLADDFMEKPFDIKTLVQKISTVLDHRPVSYYS